LGQRAIAHLPETVWLPIVGRTLLVADRPGEPLVKTALVCGAGGFIGHHLVAALKARGAWVRGVDLHGPEFSTDRSDELIVGDLKDPAVVAAAFDRRFDEVYQLAADMGGAGFIFTAEHDAEILHNSALVNLNVVEAARRTAAGKVFFASSACIYPARNQLDPQNPDCAEDSAYPADPDSEYGWEKLFSERLYLAYRRNHGLDCRIARFHNIFGRECTWRGGREKAPAAICRKVAAARDGDAIEIWGDGKQTRSFLHIDECLEGVRRMMASDVAGPLNIGSDEMISINDLAGMAMRLAGKSLSIAHAPGPLGVRGRNSDNRRIREALGWAPSAPLARGMADLYAWIEQQVAASAGAPAA
jgi:nucleoside-diphosphate-sugar epimerase